MIEYKKLALADKDNHYGHSFDNVEEKHCNPCKRINKCDQKCHPCPMNINVNVYINCKNEEEEEEEEE